MVPPHCDDPTTVLQLPLNTTPHNLFSPPPLVSLATVRVPVRIDGGGVSGGIFGLPFLSAAPPRATGVWLWWRWGWWPYLWPPFPSRFVLRLMMFMCLLVRVFAGDFECLNLDVFAVFLNLGAFGCLNTVLFNV
ncbi:hypothetical protein Hanom_Chr12g01156391 [Helianthus anomalus]